VACCDRGEELFESNWDGGLYDGCTPYCGVEPYCGVSTSSTANTGGLLVDLTDTGAAATFLLGVPLEGVVSILIPEPILLIEVDIPIGSIDPLTGLPVIGLDHSGMFNPDWGGVTKGDDGITLFEIGLSKGADTSGALGADRHETGLAAGFVTDTGLSIDFFLSLIQTVSSGDELCLEDVLDSTDRMFFLSDRFVSSVSLL
jgi:hypothetical protein